MPELRRDHECALHVQPAPARSPRERVVDPFLEIRTAAPPQLVEVAVQHGHTLEPAAAVPCGVVPWMPEVRRDGCAGGAAATARSPAGAGACSLPDVGFLLQQQADRSSGLHRKKAMRLRAGCELELAKRLHTARAVSSLAGMRGSPSRWLARMVRKCAMGMWAEGVRKRRRGE